MQNVFLTLLLLTSLCTCGRAQEIDVQQNRVAAAGGLNLRSTPSLQGKILTKIPMDSLVQVLDACDYGLDTIGTIPNFLEVYDPTTDSFTRAALPLSGAWVKATYQQDTGFLFNAYLYQYTPINYRAEHPDLFKPYEAVGIIGDYIFFQPGYELHAPIWQHNEYHWYGIFGKDSSYQVKEITLEYFVSHEGNHPHLRLAPKKIYDLIYILGSKKPIPEHTFHGLGFVGGVIDYRNFGRLPGPRKSGWLSVALDTTEKYTIIKDTYLNYLKQRQSLNTPALFNPATPYAVGDVDGDGVPDAITFHEGDIGHYILHLSREASKNKLVRPVAEEWMREGY
ncbi:MAG: SH3 domain-containing protein [Bacteroidota bacterium]